MEGEKNHTAVRDPPLVLSITWQSSKQGSQAQTIVMLKLDAKVIETVNLYYFRVDQTLQQAR